ncbi:MAG: RluA family pseudouridine synthase [Bryobacteraceae bacterium]
MRNRAATIPLRATREHGGLRLDHFLQKRLPEFSRARLQEWIKSGLVTVNGKAAKVSQPLREGDAIAVIPAPLEPLRATPEDIPLDVLYEDADVAAINKPSGMVVHAGAGVRAGTLVNALVHRFGALSTAGGELRPGIVHRLDRETSGVILVAKSDAAHQSLARQFASRRVEKHYVALVHGVVKKDGGRIDRPIARDPVRRVRMTTRLDSGRPAWTEYRVRHRYGAFTLLDVRIGTGRTHQIRVHLASIGHPVVGDRLYGAPAATLGRNFLHAARIRFESPSGGHPVEVDAPLPKELQDWLRGL